jgi:hypothetical protein
MNEPRNPDSSGFQEIHAKAERYEGIARGSEKTIVKSNRPRIPDNVTTHAVKVPITALIRVTAQTRTVLRMIKVSVRSWNTSSRNG